MVLVFAMLGLRSVVVPGALGNMSRSYIKPETGSSDISFTVEEGERIKFSFASDVQSGELDIVLYDSEGKAVYELDKAKELETFYTVEQSDTYTLSAECSEFVGNYKVVVANTD
ncbi:MAG: hypothetical protein IJ409_01870 [Lachnospiraceae bacterium]|nr:hypothetical protein [Lachnospiraceae bacterium]